MTVIANINLKEIMVHHDDTETVTCTYGDNESLSLLTYEWSGATIVTNIVFTHEGSGYNHTFTATVTNAKGNGISGKTVHFYGTDGWEYGYGATTNSNGVATMNYSSPIYGANVKAVCDGVESNTIRIDM